VSKKWIEGHLQMRRRASTEMKKIKLCQTKIKSFSISAAEQQN
jgi:hypothetical protein